jgi:hypothetical protein
MMLHEKQNTCTGQSGERLCDGCFELAEFDSQHSAQVLSPELSQIRCSLARKINLHHDPFFHHLPFELASRVFIFCVEDVMEQTFSDPTESPFPTLALKSPLHLGKVCWAWRHIAWATPQLWKTMNLLVPNTPPMSTVDLVRQWLTRSGQQPLSISLMFQNFPEKFQDVHESISSLFCVIRYYSYRWRRMQLVIPETYMDGLLRGTDSLPLLETLKVHPIFQPMHSVRIRLGNTPLLRKVEFEDLYLQSIFLEWTNLTFVSFTCVLLDELFQILRLAPGMTEFKLIGMSDDSGDYPMPVEIFTHQSLRTLYVRPEEGRFSAVLDPFFSKASFPSLVDFTYDSSLSNDQFPVDGLLSLFDHSQCSITHFALVIHEDGAPMGKEDLVLLLKILPAVTHLSLLNLDKEICLLTDHFFYHFAESLQENVNVFLPQLQVLKYEGWRSFAWEELANMCCSRSTPRNPASDAGTSKRIPKFATLRSLEFDLAQDIGTPITMHFNVYEEGDNMVDLFQFLEDAQWFKFHL